MGPRGSSVPSPPWTPPIGIHRLPLPYPLIYEVWHRWRRLPVQRATGRVDIVHATTTMVPPSGGAALVVTVHDLFPWTDPSRLNARGARLLSRGLELARDEASAILCSSEATAAACRANGFRSDRLHVVALGPSFEPPEPATTTAALRELGLDRDGYLLAVGTIEPRKNLRTLLQAVVKLERHHPLVVVGPDGWNEDLAPLIEAAGDRVRRVGFVSEATLAALCDGAMALCCPSLGEGFGMPVLDAMTVGTATVTSKDPALLELVGPEGITVDALDVDGWATALERVVDDEELRRSVGEQGRRLAAGYTWEAAADATLQVYEAVLS